MSELLNRDISWLSFNQRVSDETLKPIPLADKVLFHGITHSNLMEFVQVRYPSAVQYEETETLQQITDGIKAHYKLLTKRFEKFNKENKIIRGIQSLSKPNQEWSMKYFKDNVYPALQTVSFNKSKRLNLHAGMYVVVSYELNDETHYGYIEIPKSVSRFIQVPNKPYVIAVEDLIRMNIKKMFLNARNCQLIPVVIARSAEVMVNMDEYTDAYTLIKQTLREREMAWITFIEIGGNNGKAYHALEKVLPITPNTIILSSKYVNLSDLKKIPNGIYPADAVSRKFEPYNTVPLTTSMFSYIKKEDRLLFHPYESYQTSVVRFLEESADDPNVISIKIALYRVSDNSRIINALLKAADKGKLVTVLVELKARFDEHHNIEISNILREGGVRIMFTKPDIKTHAKVCLVTRKEKNGIRIYSHVGTGNYSESNSKQYTDYSYFSANQDLGKDLTQFFNMLTSDQGTFKSKRIIYAPYNMRSEFTDLINAQIKRATKGKKARIIAKCNSLADEKIAEQLIKAANAGVSVILIIRGACIINPQKNIEIYSIVGQFLEHSRVYAFGTGDNIDVLIGSSDLMHRNLSMRNELLIRVEKDSIRKRLISHLALYMADNTNRRVIGTNYTYTEAKHKKNAKTVSVQEEMKKEAKKLWVE